MSRSYDIVQIKCTDGSWASVWTGYNGDAKAKQINMKYGFEARKI